MSTKHPYLDFDKLKTITFIQGILVNESPLRVGVGREPPLDSTVDAAVIRMIQGKVNTAYIPGSSLKGVFRTFLEQVVRSRGVDVHPPWNAPEKEIDVDNPSPCVICGIFGNTRVASHVRVYDAIPPINPKSLIKTGVGIDRDFGGQRPGILYTEEFAQPLAEWNFRMDIVNIDFPSSGAQTDERTELLGILFRALKNQGMQVGARRSVGAGLIKLKEASYVRYAPRDGMIEKAEEGKI